MSVVLDMSSSGDAFDRTGNTVVESWTCFSEGFGEVLSAALGLRSSSCISVNGVLGVWHSLLITAPTEFLSHADTVGVVVKPEICPLFKANGMFSWGYGYVLEGENIGEAAGGDRGSCHDSNEWNESKDSADDSAGELGSIVVGSSVCASGVDPFPLSRVDVDDVRSLRAGAVAARRDANAASLVLRTRNCPEPSNAPPSA